jgi:hypothetical protein
LGSTLCFQNRHLLSIFRLKQDSVLLRDLLVARLWLCNTNFNNISAVIFSRETAKTFFFCYRFSLIWIVPFVFNVLRYSIYHHVETNRWVGKHNSYPLRCQTFVETPVHQTRPICCQLKNKTFEWSRGGERNISEVMMSSYHYRHFIDDKPTLCFTLL